MGIGNSKMNAAEGEAVPAKIRPPIVDTIEEIKKRVKGEGTLSKKNLLKDTDERDDNSQSSHGTVTEDNKVSSPKEIQIQPPHEEIPVQAIATEKLSRVVPTPISKGEIVEENRPNEDKIEQVNKDMDQTQDIVKQVVEMAEAEVKTEQGKTAEPVEEAEKEKEQELGEKVDDHDDSSDDEDESEELGRLICPGSPSFRIYCIDAEKNNEEECKSPTIIVHQKSHSEDSVETAASRNSNVVLHDVEIESEATMTTKRKGPKKKFGVIKTLLKVKSCYHPMSSCTGNDKTIVTAKPMK